MLLTVLPLVGVGVFLPRNRRRAAFALGLACALGLVVYILAVPVVLAGAIWDLISPEQAQAVSLEGLTIWAAKFILHGGGYVAIAAAVAAVAGIKDGEGMPRPKG